jgi:hypothetical protein
MEDNDVNIDVKDVNMVVLDGIVMGPMVSFNYFILFYF